MKKVRVLLNFFLVVLLSKSIRTTPYVPTLTPGVTFDHIRETNDTKLRDNVGNVVDMFGWSLAITPSHFACGILHSDGPGFRKVGSVYIYTRHGSQLTWHSHLTSPIPDSSTGFGDAIALNERHVVVSSGDKNAVYVHDLRRNIVKQKIISPSADTTNMFGASVSISSDDIIVVGADKSDMNATRETGVAFVFEPNSGGQKWIHTRTLQPSELAPHAHFGHALGIKSDYIGVAAAGQAIRGITGAGCVYVYTRNVKTLQATSETRFTILSHPNPLREDRFGYSVSFGEERIAVAAQKSENVFIFKKRAASSVNDWIVEIKLTAKLRHQGFGASVALHQNKLLVAADKCKGRMENTGCAYIYVRTRDGKWQKDRKLIANDQKSHETFGIAATMARGVAIVAKSRGYEIAKTGGGAMIRGELYIFQMDMENVGTGHKSEVKDRNERAGKSYVVFLSVMGPVAGLAILVFVIVVLLRQRRTGKEFPCGGSLFGRQKSDEFVIMVNDLEDVT